MFEEEEEEYCLHSVPSGLTKCVIEIMLVSHKNGLAPESRHVKVPTVYFVAPFRQFFCGIIPTVLLSQNSDNFFSCIIPTVFVVAGLGLGLGLGVG